MVEFEWRTGYQCSKQIALHSALTTDFKLYKSVDIAQLFDGLAKMSHALMDSSCTLDAWRSQRGDCEGGT